MAHRVACWFLVITTLLGVPAASAQTGVAKFRAACGQEFQRFCTGVQPGGGRILQCLLARRGELSAPCRSVLVAGAQGSSRAASAGRFQDSCGPDAERLCAGVPMGKRGVVKCLISQRTELSASCTSFFAEMGGQRLAQKNTRSNHPNRPTAMAPAAPTDMSEAVQPPAADVSNEATATPSAEPAKMPDAVPPPAADVRPEPMATPPAASAETPEAVAHYQAEE
jgi:Cysteine rich repeat